MCKIEEAIDRLVQKYAEMAREEEEERRTGIYKARIGEKRAYCPTCRNYPETVRLSTDQILCCPNCKTPAEWHKPA